MHLLHIQTVITVSTLKGIPNEWQRLGEDDFKGANFDPYPGFTVEAMWDTILWYITLDKIYFKAPHMIKLRSIGYGLYGNLWSFSKILLHWVPSALKPFVVNEGRKKYIQSA